MESDETQMRDRPLQWAEPIQKPSPRADAHENSNNKGTQRLLCELLLAGKPSLMIPLMQEQSILARRMADWGAGVEVPANNIEQIRRGLNRMLNEPAITETARQFARKYASYSPTQALDTVATHISDLVDRAIVPAARTVPTSTVPVPALST